MASARIHATAVVSPEAELGDNVDIGPHAVLEGKVILGDGCVIRPHACLFGPLTMGKSNVVHSGAVLGDGPQHQRYKGEPTSTEIGDHNVFREHVTIHRGTTDKYKTVIGSHNYFMVASHIGHDCVVGNHCTFVNGSMVAGHCVIDDGVLMSGNSGVHQFVQVGRLAMLSGCTVSTKDVPPFITQQGINNVVGVNVVGMRRSGMSRTEIDNVRRAFVILFRQGNLVPAAVAKLEQELGDSPAVQELLAFMRRMTRGINVMRSRTSDAA